jgi:hypothetical protein|nr:MAG TPA: hypothetical protein [Caudoviricetes sp.]
MEWHKVEDYPVGSDEYVLVSQTIGNIRPKVFCFMAKMSVDKRWYDCVGEVKPVDSTDRWCHIDLPED